MKHQQLRYSQTHTKRNGDTLYIDLNNSFSQLICTRCMNKVITIETLCIIAHFNFEVHGLPRHLWAPGRLHLPLVGPGGAQCKTWARGPSEQ